MKILFLSPIPPCQQYTGGLVLESLINFLPLENIAICDITNPAISPTIPPIFDQVPRLFLTIPREYALVPFKGKWLRYLRFGINFVFELIQGLRVKYQLLPEIIKFVKEEEINAIWIILQGQTMVRLAAAITQKLPIPLFTQVWDPFELWLRAHHIDKLTQARLLKTFDKAISSSTACATASWSMTDDYTKKYHVKNKPLIASLSSESAFQAATAPHNREEFIIGIAGQIYASEEWHHLIHALGEVNWKIERRRIKIRVLSDQLLFYTQKPVNIEYLGWHPQHEALKLLRECDLLYLPYWFSESFYRETTLSFPSKLVTYFAAGRPVFCHAPSYASPAKYIQQNNAGFLCTSLDSKYILEKLKQAITDTEEYAKVTQNGTTCFFRDFTRERMRESFFDILDYKEKIYDKNAAINTSNPKVSIIIPVYNGENYLREAIESALSQTYQNIEILVINDGSNDNGATKKIAESYSSKIYYFEKQNGGVASALNLGIKNMTGEYFSWLSHDDLYNSNKIEKQINAIANINKKRIILYSDYSIFTADPNKDTLLKLPHIAHSKFKYWITTTSALHGCTLLIPKIAFFECGLFNENLRTTQDYDMWFRLAKKYTFVHLSLSLIKARYHSAQDSIRLKKVAQRECNHFLSYCVNNLTKNEIKCASPNRSIGLAYAQIASNFWYRGYIYAGLCAGKLSLKHIFTASPKEIVIATCIIIKGVIMHFLVNPLRKILPPHIRQKIRKLLNTFNTNKNESSLDNNNPAEDEYDKLKTMSLKDKFTMVYEKNLFQGRNSRSGEGSDLVQTKIIRNEIPKLLTELGISSFLDAPCGDWFWMRQTNLNINQYIGVDIVEELIEKNQQEFSSDNILFKCLNLAKDVLPKVDLIFSRDCLVHLSYEDIIKILRNFKASGAKYLLTTTYPDRQENIDLGTGFWRPLNMQTAPFNFPAPLKLINEGCTEANNMFTDKCLGLWKLDDIL